MDQLTQETAREVYAGASRRFVQHYLSYAQIRLQDQEAQARELANLQSAMAICQQHQWLEMLAKLSEAVRFTLLDKGYWLEYRGWLEAILQHPELDTEIDQTLLLTLLDDYAAMLHNQGEPETAIKIYRRIIEMADDQQHLIRAYAHFGLGQAYFASNRLVEAEEQWQIADQEAEQAGISGWRTIINYFISSQKRDLTLPDVSIEIKEDNPTPSLMLWKDYFEAHFRAQRYLDRNELVNAEKSYTLVCDLASQLDDQDGLSLALFQLGEIARMKSDPSLALHYYRQSENIARRLENQIGLVSLYSGIARVHLGLGHYDQARPYLEECVRLEQKFGNAQALAEHLYLLGYARANTGSLDESVASFQEARQLFNEVSPERVEDVERALRRLSEIKLTAR